jgi:signal transduction histidine kinase
VRRIRALFKRATLEKVALDLNEVIGEVVTLVSGEASRKRIAIETEMQAELTAVLGDRVQLQQLLFNLITNGIEAMEDVAEHPRKLVIRSRQCPEKVLVEVRDYGVGLKDPDRVFEAFFTTKENGMGMGLAICRSIVEEHKGRLWAQPGDGAGTAFCFTLPVQPGGAL